MRVWGSEVSFISFGDPLSEGWSEVGRVKLAGARLSFRNHCLFSWHVDISRSDRNKDCPFCLVLNLLPIIMLFPC